MSSPSPQEFRQEIGHRSSAAARIRSHGAHYQKYQKEYQRKYRATPKGKAKQKEYRQNNKARRKEYYRKEGAGQPNDVDIKSLPDSDLAFGADPFGDRAASEDLPQPESQPDSEGEPFHCELYPHCGCEPAMLGFGCHSRCSSSKFLEQFLK